MTDAADQLALIRETVRRSRPKAADPPAAEMPVARVLVDVPLAHLDKPFDYEVGESQSAAAQPGVRVRVRFAGQQVDGFITERVAVSEHTGRLARIGRVVSPEPVLTPEVLRVAQQVADRYAGTLADVLRLAVPPRHARVESAAVRAASDPPTISAPAPTGWDDYPNGPRFLRALAKGQAPRAVWTALPVTRADPFALLAAALGTALAAGRGVLAVVPDLRDLRRLDAAMQQVLPSSSYVVLSADLGPAERYRRWLAVRRGQVRAVIGTRAAAWAPVAELGLVACWDDGDDLLAEPRAPYPHTREVLLLRAHEARAGVLLGGHTCTAEAAQLIDTGWARPLAATRDTARAAAAQVTVAGDDADVARDEAARVARIPSVAWRVARDALTNGPVLVQVPRAGYLPAVACARCRLPARCAHCHGPLALAGRAAAPRCGWCGRTANDRACPQCGDTRIRALRTGAARTAEELGRAFAGVPVRTSSGDHILDSVGPEPSLVIATPGAEPIADDGYAAALLLDGQLLLARPDLRASEEALRRWAAAVALVRPTGRVALVADPAHPAVQALVRADPLGFAERQLAERVQVRLPPAARLAEIEGAPEDVADLIGALSLPPGGEVLGPLPTGDDGRERAFVRAPRQHGVALARTLKQAQGMRSAAKRGGPVRVRVDPVDVG